MGALVQVLGQWSGRVISGEPMSLRSNQVSPCGLTKSVEKEKFTWMAGRFKKKLSLVIMLLSTQLASATSFQTVEFQGSKYLCFGEIQEEIIRLDSYGQVLIRITPAYFKNATTRFIFSSSGAEDAAFRFLDNFRMDAAGNAIADMIIPVAFSEFKCELGQG